MIQPIELRARREALGLSQGLLGHVLGVQQTRIAEMENGRRKIPAGLVDDLTILEGRFDRLAENTAEAIEAVHASGGQDAVLFAYRTDEQLWAAHPDLDGTPAVLHRVALATGLRFADVPEGFARLAEKP